MGFLPTIPSRTDRTKTVEEFQSRGLQTKHTGFLQVDEQRSRDNGELFLLYKLTAHKAGVNFENWQEGR